MSSGTDDRPASRRNRRDAEATRTMLLSAAKRLLLDHQAETLSTRQIASTAGVNQALIYRYFGSKRALLDEAAANLIPRSLFRSAALADLPRILLEHTLRPATADGEPANPPALAAFLAASHYPSVRQAVREGMIANFTTELAGRLDGPEPELRAELLAASLAGIAFLREQINTPALSAADPKMLGRFFEMMSKPLFDSHVIDDDLCCRRTRSADPCHCCSLP
jgi:AcrR family transcriptional regulator